MNKSVSAEVQHNNKDGISNEEQLKTVLKKSNFLESFSAKIETEKISENNKLPPKRIYKKTTL